MTSRTLNVKSLGTVMLDDGIVASAPFQLQWAIGKPRVRLTDWLTSHGIPFEEQDAQTYLTPGEVTERLRVAKTTLRNWRWKKFGPPWIKLGKNVLYPFDKLVSWENGRSGL